MNIEVLEKIKESGFNFEIKHGHDFHPEADSECPGDEVLLYARFTDEVKVCCSECGRIQDA